MNTAIFNPMHATRLFGRSFVAILFLAGLATANVACMAAENGNAVLKVETTTLPGGKVAVKVDLREPLSSTPAGFTVAKPARIALDLPDTSNGLDQNLIEANLGALTSINVVQAGTRTRLVFNLSKPVEYDTKLNGNSLLVTLKAVAFGGAIAAPTNISPVFAETTREPEKAPRHSVSDIEFRRGSNGEARIITTLSDSKTGINIRQQTKGVVVDLIDTEVPRALKRKLDVVDFATPVMQVESYELGNNGRIFIETKGTWEYSAYQTDKQFIVEVRPSADESKKTSDGNPVYSGERLSLNFQNVEVRSVLQVIADFTGLNIVASDTVAGSLTLRLKDVPWDQALDLIMNTKGLDKRTNGNVIWIAPKDELLNKEKAELEAKASVRELAPHVTEYITLNYLRADEAHAMLYGTPGKGLTAGDKVSCSTKSEGVAANAAQIGQNAQLGGTNTVVDQKLLSKTGRATYDLKTNTLVVTDTAKKIQEVRDLMAKVDVPTRQVMIETRVVVADDRWSRELGSKLLLSGGAQLGKIGGDKHNLGIGQTYIDAANRAINPGSLPVGVTAPNYNFGVSNGANFGLALLNAATGNLISLELSALEADNRGKIISSPRVVTGNQKPAVILQGQQIPYTTVEITDGARTTTVTFKDALLCLLVDPQILNNDTIIMNVEVQKDAVGEDVLTPNGSVPAIDTRRLKTQVRVANGETAVLGGIFEQIKRNDVSKIPFLGDLPFLGNLFKNTKKDETTIELMIFLTPKILDERLSLR